MSIEEKAKAYDEALKRARKIHDEILNNELLGFPDQIREIFPELRKEEKPLTPFQQCLNCILRGVYYAEVPDEKVNEFIVNVVRTRTDELIKLAKRHEYTDCQLRESEDERIRKELINFLRSPFIKENLTDEKVAPWLDWLEKQKEQEHICDSAQYEDGFKTGLEIGLRKQKEQKPIQTENEREYVKTLKGLVSDFIRNSGGGIVDTAYYQQIYDWLDRRHVEQKPAEWSEEDEERIQSILFSIGYCKDEYPNKKDYSKDIDWLKSLRPQPKKGLHPGSIRKVDNPMKWMEEDEKEREQKLVAWSEEDERMLSRCVKSIESSKQFADSDTFKKAKDNEIDWLKHLRPSWKPSEEQMNALNFAITHFVHYTNYKNLTELRELYDDLLKLQ